MLLREVDWRERNFRITEFGLICTLLKELNLTLIDSAGYTDGHRAERIKKFLSGFDQYMEMYEAELFQFKYLPEYQQEQRARQYRERLAVEEKRRQEQERAARVARFDEDSVE